MHLYKKELRLCHRSLIWQAMQFTSKHEIIIIFYLHMIYIQLFSDINLKLKNINVYNTQDTFKKLILFFPSIET